MGTSTLLCLGAGMGGTLSEALRAKNVDIQTFGLGRSSSLLCLLLRRFGDSTKRQSLFSKVTRIHSPCHSLGSVIVHFVNPALILSDVSAALALSLVSLSTSLCTVDEPGSLTHSSRLSGPLSTSSSSNRFPI